MKNKNNNHLNSAKADKNDEFYTKLEDIEREIFHYRNQFKGKTILCNCDDPYESNFFIYFALNFNFFGLKKLISTCYDGSPIAGTQLDLFNGIKSEPGRCAYKAEITSIPDFSNRGAVGMEEIKHLLQHGNVVTKLKGNGDFRSPECVSLLEDADIVVTNPPFSLFREYVNLLMEKKKKFIIVGNKTAIAYKDIFPHIMNSEIWLGYGFQGNTTFLTNGNNETAPISAVWFTNMPVTKRNEEIVLYKKYTPKDYPTYVNYDAIEVSHVCDIPRDYAGLMGVPITFLQKYNPEQFSIKGIDWNMTKHAVLNDVAGQYAKEANNAHFYLDNNNGTHKEIYERIVIQNKHPESPEGDKQKT